MKGGDKMKKRTLKLIRQKIIGIAVMISSIPMLYITREMMISILLIGIGFWLLVQKKLLSEIAMEMAKKEIQKNEEDLK